MRLTPILIQEGRKEDLQKKYSKKFFDYPNMLDYALGHPFLKETNFKYGDFILKNIHPNYSTEEYMEMIDYLKDFHRLQQSLQEKDINKYDYDGLKSAIDVHKESSKSQQKKSFDTSGARKIFEDKNILIVKPLTYEASCKYGAGTRWCTTMAGQPNYFKSHTSDQQALYYIILKNFNKDNKFYKIAIHITPNSETWYDSHDDRMSTREQEVFSLGAPKVIETIRKDYEESMIENSKVFFEKLFDFENYSFLNVSNSFKTDRKIGLEFQKSELIPDMPGHAMMELNISVDEENIDQYNLMITYEIRDKIYFNIGYSGDDFEIEPEFGFCLEDVSSHWTLSLDFLNKTNHDVIKRVFNELLYNVSPQVIYKMRNNPEFMSSIHGGTVWTPNRINYGYTFKENKGLVKKLVDYLDADKIGTKVDFLTDIGVLEKKNFKGKPYFSRAGENDWHRPAKWRGQHSGFFNSAKLAGILDYDKKGNQFYLKKGPNFEKFKSGQLKAL